MRITSIGHASILIETRGLRILSDPWWRGPCFGAQWWTYPLPYLEPVHAPIDFIYVSHGHHDHLHPGTLKQLDPNATVLVSANLDIAESIAELGFKVVRLHDDQVQTLAPGVTCRIIETHADDTLFAIDDGDSVCVNLNDALHSAPDEVQARFIATLKSYYPKIDYLFCGYGVASHFPNCYRIPGKNAAATAAKRQAYFNRRWASIVQRLEPRFAFPFAADVAFLENDLLWSNEPTQNTERPTDVFKSEYPSSPTAVMDVAPGFEITDAQVTREVLRQPTSVTRLQADHAEGVSRANAYGTVSKETFDEVVRLLAQNVERCMPYLQEYPGDYRFLVRFRNYSSGIEVRKCDRAITVAAYAESSDAGFDVVYRTRVHYLRMSLTTQYGHEILFVGSGGIFEYAAAADARANLHRELMTVLVPHEQSPPSRFGRSSASMFHLKRAVKRWLRRQSDDLYDLGRWTVWDGDQRT